MPLREDLVIGQGTSWLGPLWALIGLDGAPVSLDGKVVQAQVRHNPRDASVLHEWSTEHGNIAVYDDVAVPVDHPDGRQWVTTIAVALTVKPSESRAWTWTTGVYDVQIADTTNPDDVWSVVEQSAVRVVPEVTR